jgi:prepilin-type N-terminal cleavage/methylation domain-containing protein
VREEKTRTHLKQVTGAELQKTKNKGTKGGKTQKEMKMIHRGEKGFTLIELLVVIAILGVIAAVVALNISGFFGRGTLQAANTELHQAQTAIISAMADAESNVLQGQAANQTFDWAGEPDVILAVGPGNTTFDAADYCYGPFRATYTVTADPNGDAGNGAIIWGDCDYDGGWGTAITWNTTFMTWSAAQ